MTGGASVEGVEGYEERPPSPAPETTIGGGIYAYIEEEGGMSGEQLEIITSTRGVTLLASR